jgi:hypothetical protein
MSSDSANLSALAGPKGACLIYELAAVVVGDAAGRLTLGRSHGHGERRLKLASHFLFGKGSVSLSLSPARTPLILGTLPWLLRVHIKVHYTIPGLFNH